MAAALLQEAAKAPDQGEKIETVVKARWHVLHELNLAFNVGRLIRPRMQRHWAFASAREEGCFALNLGQMAILTDWYLAEFSKVLKTCEIVAAPRFPEPLPMRGVTYSDSIHSPTHDPVKLAAPRFPEPRPLISGIHNDADKPSIRPDLNPELRRAFEESIPLAELDRAAAEKEWLKFGLPYPMPDRFWKRPKELAAPVKEPEKGGGG